MSVKVENLDLYLLLEVSPGATKEEIKKAYYKKAVKCHPDKNPGNSKATQEFQALLNAYTILSDDNTRRAYDMKAGKARNADAARRRNEQMRSQWEEAQRKRRERQEAAKEKWRQWGFLRDTGRPEDRKT